MNEPTFWRTELWHPLTLHFPIALLLFATVAKVVAAVLRGERAVFWQKVGSLLLLVGGATVWVSVYTGDMAEGIVARKICDPILLKRHESASYTLAWLFTAALALQLLLHFNLLRFQQKAFRVLTLLLMLIGSGYLLHASHLGAQVVYEQGGGVNVPPSNCAGY
ncbi:membrane protein [Pontibacter sp. HJ8]